MFDNQSSALLREAERAIHLVDERFQYAALATNHAVYDLDLRTNNIFWSNTYEYIFGYPLTDKECETETWISRLHPADKDQTLDSLYTAINNRKHSWCGEYRYKCANGKYMRILDQGYIIYDSANEPLRMIGAMQDITERRIREEEIQKKSAYLQQLFYASPLGIVMLDANDRIVDVNPGFEAIFQYSIYEIRGKYINEVIVPENLQEEANLISSNCLNKSQLQKNSIRRRRDGSLVDVEIVGYPIIIEGELSGIYGIYVDVSERKKAEEKIKKSEQQYRTLINTLNEGLLQVDNDDRIQFVNSRYCEMIGYSEEELLGQTSYELVFANEEDKDFIRNRNKQRLTGVSERYEIQLRRKDGSYIWTLISASPVRDSDGNIIGSLGAITDITEQKRNEMILKAKNAELQKTNAELDRFVYSASHDLRAPLTSILGLVNLLEMNCTDDQLEYIKFMRRSVHRLDSFIQDIINYSRNSRVEIAREKIDFRTLVSEVIDDLKHIEGAELINGIYNIEEGEFYGDKKRIYVLLNNLISNAIKYHNLNQPNPHIYVNVKIACGNAIIEVGDNGLGIDPEYQVKIFEMFFRASEVSKGSGLGLYIVKEIVNTLNGEISVQSELNKGTVFTLSLPEVALPELHI